MKKSRVDVFVQDDGSIALFRPATKEAEVWFNEHISDDAQWFGSRLVVERRYVDNLVAGLQGDGLIVTGEN